MKETTMMVTPPPTTYCCFYPILLHRQHFRSTHFAIDDMDPQTTAMRRTTHCRSKLFVAIVTRCAQSGACRRCRARFGPAERFLMEGCSIDEKTLRKHFRDELSGGKFKVDMIAYSAGISRSVSLN
jgi:hypothetical protein